VEFAPEQRAQDQAYVNNAESRHHEGEMGRTLPADVRLSPVPADWGCIEGAHAFTLTTASISSSRAHVRLWRSSI